jgi:hypothetical protein
MTGRFDFDRDVSELWHGSELGDPESNDPEELHGAREYLEDRQFRQEVWRVEEEREELRRAVAEISDLGSLRFELEEAEAEYRARIREA